MYIAAAASFSAGERGHRAVEVILDDPRSTAEAAQRLGAEPPRSAFGLDLPEALEDELEMGRLDPSMLCGAFLGAPETRVTEPDSTGLDRVEGVVHELVLDLDGLVCGNELVVALERAANRAVGGTAIETVEAQRVPKQAGQLRLEGVELGERVFANAEDDVHPRPGLSDRIGKRRQRPPSRFVTVVEEVLLELVEDEVQVGAEAACPAREYVRGGAGRGALGVRDNTADFALDRRQQPADRIAAPAGHDRHRRALPAKPVCDARAEERRLPDAARAVQHGEPAPRSGWPR